jgi:hypothetical protein
MLSGGYLWDYGHVQNQKNKVDTTYNANSNDSSVSCFYSFHIFAVLGSTYPPFGQSRHPLLHDIA